MTHLRTDLISRIFLLLCCSIVMGCGNIHVPEQIIPQAVAGVLDLRNWDFQSNEQIPLEGEWRFLWEELRTPQEMAESKDGSFVVVPEKWHHYVINGESPDYRGYGTFSLTLLLPEEDYGFSFDGAGSAYSLWMNEDLLMQGGTVGKSKDKMVPDKLPQSVFYHSSGEPLELVIHISNYHHRKGGFRNSLYIGSVEQIQSAQRKAWTMEAFTLGILFIMGLYHLFVYFFRRIFNSAFYFALLCFAFLLRLGITNQDLLLLSFPFISWNLAFYLDYFSLFFIPPLVAQFYRSLFPQEISRRFVSLISIFGLTFSLFAIIAGTYIASFSIKYYQILILLEIAYYLHFLILINIRKREGALVITMASLVLFATSSVEIFSLWNWLGGEKIGVYGFLSFILVQSILLSRRYSKALDLEKLALTDPLTNAYNRRFFTEFVSKERERAQRTRSPFSLVMLDIDFFKKVNDKYGHLKGDEVLINLTKLCIENIRSTDIFARFGGEEFVILFSDSDGIETAKRAELLREIIASAVLSRNCDEKIRVTVSMGVSCWNPEENTELTELLDQVDKALYQAKESGRNRVVLFQENSVGLTTN